MTTIKNNKLTKEQYAVAKKEQQNLRLVEYIMMKKE